MNSAPESSSRAEPIGLAILIPALNCARTIGSVVEGARLHGGGVPILVVDDGSTDETGAIARSAGAEVIRHAERQGKGAALRTGLEFYRDRGVTSVLTMDADGQHLADEIPKLLQAVRANPHALVIGDRHMESVTTKPINKFGNRFANRWVEIACGRNLPDTQSGFRVYPLETTLGLGAHAKHFGFETEVLIRAARAGIDIQSVPVRVYYPPIEERVSHFEPFVDTVRIIFIVLGLIFRVW